MGDSRRRVSGARTTGDPCARLPTGRRRASLNAEGSLGTFRRDRQYGREPQLASLLGVFSVCAAQKQRISGEASRGPREMVERPSPVAEGRPLMPAGGAGYSPSEIK